jgi:TatD DNase family protein
MWGEAVMLFDSHAHLLDPRFDGDRQHIIARLPERGVEYVAEIGCCIDTSIRAAALAKEHHIIWAVVGVHPHDAKTWDGHSGPQLRALAKEGKVVAIGEIGLDYHYDFSPRDVQADVFERQMQLAQDLKLPVVIHSREATADTLDVLRRFPQVTGMMHSFSGSVETMELLIKIGYYISFNGSVTFKNAQKPVEAAARVPLERILVETDCPYMTPAPFRGKRNDPGYVGLVAQKIADIRGTDVEEIETATAKNAGALYGIEVR